MKTLGTVKVSITGLGIIMYSPSSAKHIKKGEDYLDKFWEPEDVEKSIIEGAIVAFGTGGGGNYVLRLWQGPPDEEVLQAKRYKLRLGIKVVDGEVHFRDLYDMLEWTPKVPKEQRVAIPNGTYRLTLMTEKPALGFGSNQEIDIHFESWPGMPKLNPDGVPMLNE